MRAYGRKILPQIRDLHVTPHANPPPRGLHQSLSTESLIFPITISFVRNGKNRNHRELVICQKHNYKRRHSCSNGIKERTRVKGKENVWSVDNEAAEFAAKTESKRANRRRKRRIGNRVKRTKGGRVMVSGALLMEVENVLQTREPVIRPAWDTFISSVIGRWKGVGAAFSPVTAEMEPIELGSNDENLYDCYTLSCIEAVPSPCGSEGSQIQRKINWVTLNPHGELKQQIGGSVQNKEIKGTHVSLPRKPRVDKSVQDHDLPIYESYDFTKSDVMEEDVMGMEPGLIFFEDGSYSRGPIEIPVGVVDESKHFLSPTFRFEQCLVKGCHRRLRIIHTIELEDGGLNIRTLRVAVYKEQCVSSTNIQDQSNMEFDSKPLSRQKRVQPTNLTGRWKVFETRAAPIYSENVTTEESNDPPYAYFCSETVKKRSFPGEEETVEISEATVLWLLGGATSYVDVSRDGTLCIGVGWYSDEGINLVMERDYGIDGKLKEVRWKSEVER